MVGVCMLCEYDLFRTVTGNCASVDAGWWMRVGEGEIQDVSVR